VNLGRHSEIGMYERSRVLVDHALEDELAGDVGARLCRIVGNEAAQVAICRAIIQVAGNLLAKLAGAADAERFHRARATHYAVKAAREPARWVRRR
jgi:hypothetical protein